MLEHLPVYVRLPDCFTKPSPEGPWELGATRALNVRTVVGSNLWGVIGEMIELAKLHHITVIADFNGRLLTATETSMPEEIGRQYR